MINKKKYQIILRFLFPLFIIGSMIIYVIYNKPHKDFEKSPIEDTIESINLISFYQDNPDNANTRFLDKFILVIGTITDIEKNIIILDNSIVCTLDPSQIITNQININNEVSVKGRCIGYDDLLEEVRIDHSFIMKSP
tara:strand:+ start:2726 stop:3139 length:414 start_codon:yes stop_codon:yes gene_type:complete